MALKFKHQTKAEIPAELRSLYGEREGAWVLDVEGAVEKSKLDEFRNTNAALSQERDELKRRFEGIDPDEVRKLADEKRKLEEAQQVKSGEVEKVVEARVKAVKTELDRQLGLYERPPGDKGQGTCWSKPGVLKRKGDPQRQPFLFRQRRASAFQRGKPKNRKGQTKKGSNYNNSTCSWLFCFCLR